MKVLIISIEREVIIVNIIHLLVNCRTPWKSIGFYNAVNNLFVLHALNKNRILNSVVWKTYQKILLK